MTHERVPFFLLLDVYINLSDQIIPQNVTDESLAGHQYYKQKIVSQTLIWHMDYLIKISV